MYAAMHHHPYKRCRLCQRMGENKKPCICSSRPNRNSKRMHTAEKHYIDVEELSRTRPDVLAELPKLLVKMRHEVHIAELRAEIERIKRQEEQNIREQWDIFNRMTAMQQSKYCRECLEEHCMGECQMPRLWRPNRLRRRYYTTTTLNDDDAQQEDARQSSSAQSNTSQ